MSSSIVIGNPSENTLLRFVALAMRHNGYIKDFNTLFCDFFFDKTLIFI